jgi:hypothetical protein
MAKCEKCGGEYPTAHIRIIVDGKADGIPQAKLGCPVCDKDQNLENQRKFNKDMFDRLNNRSKNLNLES